MGTVSLERTTLKDRPCIWHHIIGGTPETGANGWSLKMIEKPTRDSVTC